MPVPGKARKTIFVMRAGSFIQAFVPPLQESSTWSLSLIGLSDLGEGVWTDGRQKSLIFYRNQINFDDFVAWNVAFGSCVNSQTFNGGSFLVSFSATATYFMAR